jgi:hypothetical protein
VLELLLVDWAKAASENATRKSVRKNRILFIGGLRSESFEVEMAEAVKPFARFGSCCGGCEAKAQKARVMPIGRIAGRNYRRQRLL